MNKVSIKLQLAVENVFWSDTSSRMLEAFLSAAQALDGLEESDFHDEASRREFRCILEIADEYKDLRGHYSTDIKNEARDALSLLLELYRRDLLES